MLALSATRAGWSRSSRRRRRRDARGSPKPHTAGPVGRKPLQTRVFRPRNVCHDHPEDSAAVCSAYLEESATQRVCASRQDRVPDSSLPDRLGSSGWVIPLGAQSKVCPGGFLGRGRNGDRGSSSGLLSASPPASRLIGLARVSARLKTGGPTRPHARPAHIEDRRAASDPPPARPTPRPSHQAHRDQLQRILLIASRDRVGQGGTSSAHTGGPEWRC